MPTTYMVTVSGSLFGQTVQNVMHFVEDAGAHTLTQVADEIDSLWIDQIKTWQHNQFTWLNIEVRVVNVLPVPAAFNKTINKPGTSVGASSNNLPTTCALLRLFTGFSGPKGQGRLYIGGIPASSYNLGIFTSADLTAKQTAINNLKAKFVGPSHLSFLKWVVCGRHAGDVGIDITDINVRPVVSTQRRRNYGVGV